jgi:hypothetical protein
MLIMLVTTVVLSVTGAAPSSKKPHIVQMILDDLGWNDVGWNNPRLKKLLKNTVLVGEEPGV